MGENEIHAWCQPCWESIALPRINEFAVGATTLKMIQAVCERQEFKDFIERNPGDHRSALIAFLNPRNPACCFLGAEKVREIIDSSPIK